MNISNLCNNIVDTAMDLAHPYPDAVMNSSANETIIQIFNDSLQHNPYVNTAIAFGGGILTGKTGVEIGDGRGSPPSLKQVAVAVFGIALLYLSAIQSVDERGDFKAETIFVTATAYYVGFMSGMLGKLCLNDLPNR